MPYEPSDRLSEILGSSLNGMREFASVQSAFGQPIHTPSGMTVIPVSRISVGFATGGIGLPKKRQSAEQEGFGGGGGSGISVSPIAFLTVASDEAVRLIPVADRKEVPIERIVDLVEEAPQIAEKIKKTFFG